MRRWMLVVGQLLAAGCIFGVAASDDRLVIAMLLCLAGIATASLSINLYAVAQMFAGPRAAGNLDRHPERDRQYFGHLRSDHFRHFDRPRSAMAAPSIWPPLSRFFGGIWWVVGMPRIAQVKVD